VKAGAITHLQPGEKTVDASRRLIDFVWETLEAEVAKISE
jgi:hypothetical protein